MSNRSRHLRILFIALVVAAILGVPIAAGAQTPNGISSPAAGATVRGTVDVKGYADDPNFGKWQLDLLPGGDPNAAIFLALGTTPRDFVYALDTTKWPDGNHALRERVVRANGNYDEFITKFTIANHVSAAAGAATASPAARATPVATAVTRTVTAATAVTRTATTATPVPLAKGMSAPTGNGISAPPNGATVSGAVNVTGSAGGPNFQKWQLDLLPGRNANAPIFLSLGNAAGVFTYTLNSTLYPNGQHALRLRNVRVDGNYDEYTDAITITNGSATAPAAGATPVAGALSPTQVITYQPAADPSLTPVQATCAASTALPNRGAYRCSTTAGATFDPCMVTQGNSLMCPNTPKAVTATNTLPSVPKTGAPAPFTMNLAGNYPQCNVNMNPSMTLNGQPVTFACAAPGAWLLGPPNTSGVTWVVQYVTTDTQGTKVTSGPTAANVTRALVY